MDRFVWEPGERLIVGTNVRARTARDLLRRLAVENAPLNQQRDAVEGWLLTANEPPDALLRVSLKRRGLLPTSKVQFIRPLWGRSFAIGNTNIIETEPLAGAGLERTRSGLRTPA